MEHLGEKMKNGCWLLTGFHIYSWWHLWLLRKTALAKASAALSDGLRKREALAQEVARLEINPDLAGLLPSAKAELKAAENAIHQLENAEKLALEKSGESTIFPSPFSVSPKKNIYFPTHTLDSDESG